MTYEEAMSQAALGRHMILPHWHWVYVSGDDRGKFSLYEDDGSRRGAYRSTGEERRSTEWMDYADPPSPTPLREKETSL